MACNDRQLAQSDREAGYSQQRTGVPIALRPFTGAPTLENLFDYLNRELVPAVQRTRNAANEVYLQVADQAPSANPLAYYFSTSVAASDPTDGRIKLNQATQDTATIIRVSENNARLQSVLPWLDVMSGGATTPLGTVTLIDSVNPGRFLRFDLNTMTDQGAYWDLGVTFIEGSHDNPFVEDEAVVLAFISGVSAAGSTVPVGSLSPVATDTFLGNISGSTQAPSAVPLADVDSTSIVYDATSHTFQRAALTGFATASQNSNATSSAEPIVTYSASANMSAERVLSNGDSIDIDIGTAGQIQPDYVGSTTNVNLTSVSGAQGVIDISTIACGGSVTVESVSGDYTVAGFTVKPAGFWFWFIDRRTSGTAAGQFLEDSGSATTSIRNESELPTVIGFASRTILYYAGTRWRALAASSVGSTQNEGTGGQVTLNAGTKVLAVTANVTIDGFARSGGNVQGDRFWLRSNDGIETTLLYASGTAGDRMSLPRGEDMVVPGRGMLEFRYEDTSWRAISTGNKGCLLRRTAYTSGSGTHTYLSDCRRAVVKMVGGGGGGGGCEGGAVGTGGAAAGGGGAGAYLELDIEPSPASSAYSVGAAGTAGAASGGGTGGTGGDTTFHDGSATRTAAGGEGGEGDTLDATTHVGGQPGGGGALPSSTGAFFRSAGNPGAQGVFFFLEGIEQGWSGTGGAGPFGGAGAGQFDVEGAGNAGNGPGSGGGGAYTESTTDRAGGAGAAGLIIVEEYT